MDKGIDFYKKIIDRFNGKVFRCKDAIIFYKRNNIENPYDKQNEFLRLYREAHVDSGDCIFVDFMAAKISPENTDELKDFFFKNQQIKYVMASRKGEIFLKQTKELRAIADRMGNIGSFISSLVS